MFAKPFDIIVGGDSDENGEEDEDDDADAVLKRSALGKRTTRTSISCSSKDIFEIDANRCGTRSGAKNIFNDLAKATVEVVKQFTASKKTTVHDEVNQAVSSRKKKLILVEQNEATGLYDKVRCVVEDSQSYELVNAVFSDGKAVQFDSQTY